MRVRGLPFRLFHAACWHHLLNTLHRAPFGESAVASEIQLLLLPAPSPHAILHHRQEIELDESTSDELDAAFSRLYLVVNQGAFSRTRVKELRWESERERSASDACIDRSEDPSFCSQHLSARRLSPISLPLPLSCLSRDELLHLALLPWFFLLAYL